MITEAQITATLQPSDPHDESKLERGDPKYPISITDLLRFGESPQRWVRTPRPEATPKPRSIQLIRCMLLAAGALPATYIRRPDQYESLVATCPGCGSVSPSKSCRTCNLTRVKVATTRDWAATADYCKKWTAERERHGARVIAPTAWDTAQGVKESLAADPNFRELMTDSRALCTIEGKWHDEETGLHIPIHTLVDFIPNEGSILDMTVGSLSLTADATHGQWASIAYSQGLHIRAAFKHALVAAATGDPRPTHLWCLCERTSPHIVGRRRSTPELLNTGRDTMQELLRAYATAVKTQTWPAFDPAIAGSVNAWTEVYLEPWMTQGAGVGGGYFALRPSAKN